MEEVKIQVLHRTLRQLEALGAKFHIALGDQEFGEPLHQPAKRERPNKGVVSYLTPYLRDMKVGQVVEIPLNGYDFAASQSSAAYVVRKLYNGMAATARVNNAIQVMRVE